MIRSIVLALLVVMTAATWSVAQDSRPHLHPNDRFFVVLAGTWWMGTGETFDPEKTVPAPAGPR